MSSLFQISKSALLGFGLYQSYRNSRVFLAGWHEQKSLCTVDHIGNLALLAIAAQNNVTALWGSTLASRITKLSYASYAFVPALHYLSNHLDDSRVKEAVDFTYLHLTDLVLIGTAIHTVAALRFGYNIIGNAIQLSFVLLSALEQGTFWMDPKQNQGVLAKTQEGEIYRTYQPIVAKLSYYLGLPFQFFFKGMIGKALSLMILFLRYAPASYKGALIPDEMKKGFQDLLERERQCAVQLSPKGDGFPKSWALDNQPFQKMLELDMEWAVGQVQAGVSIHEVKEGLATRLTDTLGIHFSLTERHLEPIGIEDFFPNQTLAELELELQRQLEADTNLSRENRATLRDLLGTQGQPGLLRNVVINSSQEILREERTRVFKGVFGAIGQNWEERNRLLINRKGDFLCDTATANSMKNLYFEFYPILKYPEKGGIVDALALGVRLQSEMALVFQQYRDHGFSAGIQGWSSLLRKHVTNRAEEEIQEHRDHLYEEIRDLSNISTKLWWKNLFQYIWKTIQAVLWQNFTHFLEHMGTNRHEVNLHIALYGKKLGLSDYEEARDDMEKLLQQFSLSIDLLDEMASHVSEFFKIQVLKLHDKIWYGNLLECILEPSDERVRSDHLLTYMNYRAAEFSKDYVQTEIGEYFGSPDENELKFLVGQHLPQALLDFDFLQVH